MKFIKLFLILMVLFTDVFVTNTAAQTYAGGKTAVQGIERQVFKKLIRLPYYGVFDHINFQVDGETVILNGKVTEPRNKRDAQNAIKKIAGVERVVNNIEVLPPSPFDASIRYRLLRTFARYGGAFRYVQEPNPSVRLIVEGGRVILEGYVATRGDSNLMNILANGVSNVFSVKNNLIVEKELVR